MSERSCKEKTVEERGCAAAAAAAAACRTDEWMPAKRVCCLTSADRLTSGSLRLLIDTKETGALLAHSPSRTCSRAGKWTLFIRALDDQCGFSWKQSSLFRKRWIFLFFFLFFCGFLCCVWLRLESVLPRLTLYSVHKGCSAIALVSPTTPTTTTTLPSSMSPHSLFVSI